MKSVVIKRSILINGRKTSVSLENEFWEGLREIADRGMIAHSTLVEQIDQERDNVNLSSAIRVFVFNHFRSQGRVRPAGNFEASRGESMKLQGASRRMQGAGGRIQGHRGAATPREELED